MELHRARRETARLAALTLVVLLALVGCSPAPPTSLAPPPASPGPTIAAVATVAAPSATPEPTDDIRGIPTSTPIGWWGDDTASCGFPASYRLDGKVEGVGPCLGVLSDPPDKIVTMAVGQDLELHMSVGEDGGQSMYPLPDSSDRMVIDAWFIADSVTMTYRALSAGTARLVTTGNCLIKDDSAAGSHQVSGPCPVLQVEVAPIPTTCIDLELDVCHAAGAAAIGSVSFPVPDQAVVSWEARPGLYAGKDWPGCGTIVAEVAINLRNPAEVKTVTMGSVELDSADSTTYRVCTY